MKHRRRRFVSAKKALIFALGNRAGPDLAATQVKANSQRSGTVSQRTGTM